MSRKRVPKMLASRREVGMAGPGNQEITVERPGGSRRWFLKRVGAITMFAGMAGFEVLGKVLAAPGGGQPGILGVTCGENSNYTMDPCILTAPSFGQQPVLPTRRFNHGDVRGDRGTLLVHRRLHVCATHIPLRPEHPGQPVQVRRRQSRGLFRVRGGHIRL